MSLLALFTGTSGLAANSTALDVIGNNLANLNTTGYKAQRTLFKDLVYQNLGAGSPPTGTTGGTNPSQVGNGISAGGISSQFTQGAVTPTGQPLDAAIQGRGFFVVSNGLATSYTRDGSFNVDAAGYLVDPNTGYRVQRTGNVGEGTAATPGYQAVNKQDIRVPLGVGSAGVPTANVVYQGNLNSALAVGESTTTGIQVNDSQSTPRALSLTFTKTAPNTFSVTPLISGGTASVPVGTTVTFDANGLLVSPGTLAVSISGIPGANAQTITLNFGTPGTTNGLTQFGGTSTAGAITQDGSGFGTLTSVSIDNQGIVQGLLSNGRTVAVAQLAIAGFNNEAGLVRVGTNYFAASASSGSPVVGPAGSGGLGSVQGSALEGTNVDIASEFSRLIIAQRGFSANAKLITASNDSLQELTNIIR